MFIKDNRLHLFGAAHQPCRVQTAYLIFTGTALLRGFLFTVCWIVISCLVIVTPKCRLVVDWHHCFNERNAVSK